MLSAYGVALAAVALLFFLIGARWLWLYRYGQPLDIDEAGYLGFALVDYYALVRTGLAGWLTTIDGPSIQAPVTTALASALFYGTGPHVIAGFAVPLLAGVGVILATYALGKAVCSRGAGLAAAVLVASCPVVINFSRSFHFAIPTTLVVTIMLLAVVKSDRFARVGWAVLFGLCLGLLPLTRTMTVAFMPGAVAAAFIAIVVDPVGRIRRLCWFAGSLLLAVLTAATWLGPNGRLVYHYLSDFGYGARAAEYGVAQSKFGPDAWLNMLIRLCNGEIYLPHTLVVVAGGAATLILAGAALLRGGPAALPRILRSRALPVTVFVAEALLALTSSRNTGSAFFAPIVPPMMVITAWACSRISGHRYYRGVLAGLVAVVAIVASAPLIDLKTPWAGFWMTWAPGLGGIMIADGRGTLQRYEAASGFGPPEMPEPVSPASGHAWITLNAQTAALIARLDGVRAGIAFGFRNPLYNVNTVNLAELLSTGIQFATRQVEPQVTGESVAGYAAWLQTEAADACVLLTSDRPGTEFLPAVNRADMAAAAQQTGFVPDQQWPTPNGQVITLWKHKIAPPNCH